MNPSSLDIDLWLRRAKGSAVQRQKDMYKLFGSEHQGLLLHSVYHRPNGWDYIPDGKKIQCNESSMWGDYHMRELGLYLWRIINNDRYYTFFNGAETKLEK